MGKRPFRAAIDACAAIGFAVVAITATIVAVFLPVSFIGGYIGRYFTQFGITVSVAVLASMLVARMATPLLAAYLMQPKAGVGSVGRGPYDQPGKLMARYIRLLDWSLQHRRLALWSGVAFLVGSLLLIPMLPTGFLPASDLSLTQVNIETPPGTPLTQTDEKLREASSQIARRKEVNAVFTLAGGQDAAGANDVSKGMLLVQLKPPSERALSQKGFEQSLQQDLSQFDDIRFTFQGGSDGRDVSIILLGADPKKLSEIANELQRQMRGVAGIVNTQVNEPLARPQLLIQPRLHEAALAGISATSIANVTRIATLGEVDASSARFNLPDRQIPIRVALDERSRSDLHTLQNLSIPTEDGNSVPLHVVATIDFADGPARIERFDRLRRVSVDADLSPGVTLGDALDSINTLPVLQTLPESVRRVEYGDAQYMSEMFDKFGVAMGFGILMVYAVLVLLFKDFLQPVTILVALPLSIGGAIVGLLLYGAALDLPAIIGILMLMGIVTKNSILLVEFANEKRREGVSRKDSLLRSGAERARPIIMTTIAMAAGMVPAVLSSGADSGFRAPMAIAVIGGLITSTALSLVFVPVMFTYMDDLRMYLAQRLTRLTSVTEIDRKEGDSLV